MARTVYWYWCYVRNCCLTVCWSCSAVKSQWNLIKRWESQKIIIIWYILLLHVVWKMTSKHWNTERDSGFRRVFAQAETLDIFSLHVHRLSSQWPSQRLRLRRVTLCRIGTLCWFCLFSEDEVHVWGSGSAWGPPAPSWESYPVPFQGRRKLLKVQHEGWCLNHVLLWLN